jgi:hypothetical protein
MTSGILTAKWYFLRRPLQVTVANAGKIFLACARLQNFIINNMEGVYLLPQEMEVWQLLRLEPMMIMTTTMFVVSSPPTVA